VTNLRLVRIVIGAMILALTGVGIASAQTTTTSTMNVPKKDPPKKPWLIIHVTPQWKYMLGQSDLPRPDSVCSKFGTPLTGGTCGQAGSYEYADGQTRLGYGANINLGTGLSLNYTHSYIDQTIGRVTTVTNAYTYQAFNDDRVDDGNLAYAIPHFYGISVAFGYHQRVRMCCGNKPGSANKNWYESWYGRLTDRVGPNSKYFGRLVGLTAQADWIPHDNNYTGAAYFASPYCTLSAAECLLPQNGAIANGGDKLKWTGTFNITYPLLNPKSPFALYGQYFNDWDYYYNSPIMYLYNNVQIGFIYHYNSIMTIQADDTNLYQHHEGYPYVFPNTINRDRLDLSVDFAAPFFQ
jgi:hypothetical protein